MEVLTMAPTLHNMTLLRQLWCCKTPYFREGHWKEQGPTALPGVWWPMVTHSNVTSATIPSCSHLCRTLKGKRLWKRWQDLQEETMRGCKRAGRGGGGGSSQSVHLEVIRGYCTMKSTGQFYFHSGDVALSGIVTLVCSPQSHWLWVSLAQRL